MRQLTFAYSGQTLVAHLAAYGLAAALDDAGVPAFVGHDPDSPSFEPVVWFDAEPEGVAAVVRDSADAMEAVVEADLVPGRRGNHRRSVIWARASFARDPSQAADVLRRREELRRAVPPERRLVHGVLAGIGAPAAWGSDRVRPSAGATALDGVLGNHTSDLIRGVLRPARRAAAELADDAFDRPRLEPVTGEKDKTGWAPPGTRVDLAHQWLAVLGLSLLPVAHRPREGSRTPACWTVRDGETRHGVTLPILRRPVAVGALRVLLGLAALPRITRPRPGDDELEAVGELRRFGVDEVVVFERRYGASSGSSVSFTYRRGIHVSLRP